MSSFFCLFYELGIWNDCFITNITIYQPDGSETTGFFLLPPWHGWLAFLLFTVANLHFQLSC